MRLKQSKNEIEHTQHFKDHFDTELVQTSIVNIEENTAEILRILQERIEHGTIKVRIEK